VARVGRLVVALVGVITPGGQIERGHGTLTYLQFLRYVLYIHLYLPFMVEKEKHKLAYIYKQVNKNTEN